MAPVIAGIVVAGCGYLVWMFQLVAGARRLVIRGRHPATRKPEGARKLHITSLVVHSTPKRWSAWPA
jgi:hypothetical protein